MSALGHRALNLVGQDSVALPPNCCLFLVVPNGFTAANLLRTDTLPRLLQQPELHIVLLTPMASDPEFVGEFQHPRIAIEPLPPHTPSGIEAAFWSLLQARMLRSTHTDTMRIKLAIELRDRSRSHGSLRRVVRDAVARLPIAVEQWFALSDRLVRDPYHEELFERYCPNLVVTATPGLIPTELPVLRVASRRRVSTVAADISWDNLTNKLAPIRRLSRLIVWNELLREQAVRYHGYRSDQIDVVGVPQFDLYADPSAGSDRERFLATIGAPADRRILTVATTPPSIYPDHVAVIRTLDEAIRRGDLPSDLHILVRLHPRDDASRYASLAGVPTVSVEKPFRAIEPTPDRMNVDISLASRVHLADTLRFSSVVINAASTVTIEACVFDTPVVNIRYDATPRDYYSSVRRYYDFTHYQPLVRSDAVAVADSPGELVRWVSRYLEDPGLHADGRARVVAEQCQAIDGHAAERVADRILEAMSV